MIPGMLRPRTSEVNAMNARTIGSLFFLGLVTCVFAAPAHAAWGTTDWKVRCVVLDAQTGADYESSPGLLTDACEYQLRATGESLLVGVEEREAVRAQLASASTLLSSDGFPEPAVPNVGDQWEAKFFPGDCWCSGPNCCAQTRDSNTLGTFYRIATGSISDEGDLFIKASGISQHDERGVTAAHELLHASVWSSPSARAFAAVSGDPDCIPSCWIGEGGAEAFGYFWGRREGLSVHAGFNRTYDIPLPTSDYSIGTETGELWQFIAEKQGSFAFLRHIYEQSFDTDPGIGEYVSQAHEGLAASGYRRGLFGAYRDFVATLDDDSYYANVGQARLENEDDTKYLEMAVIEPIAVEAGRVIVAERAIDLSDRPEATVKLKIQLEEAENENLHLLVEGVLKESGSFQEDITDAVRGGQEVTRFVQVANIAETPHLSEAQEGVRVEALLEVVECPYFELTVRGPLFGQPQTFEVDPALIPFNAAAGGTFTTRFQDRQNRNAVSEDGSVLTYFIGGASLDSFSGPGSYPLGPTSPSASNGWGLRIWAQAAGCPSNFAGCVGITMQTQTGTIDVNRFVLGKGLSRPHLEGPTFIDASFEVDALGNKPTEDTPYQLEGRFCLEE